jgi:hypothetical protein
MMIKINENYLKLQASYLFAAIKNRRFRKPAFGRFIGR